MRLGDVAYIASGSTPSKDCFVERGVPYLKMYNLRNQQIDFEYKPQYIKREIHEGKLARSKAKPGDVIMNIVGPPLGKVAIVPESLPECNFNQAAVLIRAHFCTNLMNQYIRYFLLQMDEINAINTKGTAGQENISLTQTQNMRLPLPPLAEQQRIVAKIEEAFAEIDAVEKNKELLKTHIKQTRKKILDLAIHGKLVLQNKNDEPASVLLERITRDNPHYEKIEDGPFEIPQNWAWVALGSLSSLITKGTTPRGGNVAYIDNGVGFIRAENIPGMLKINSSNMKFIDSATHQGFLARSIIKEGDILITIAGSLGRTAIVHKSDLPLNTNQAISIVRLYSKKDDFLKYVVYALNSSFIQELLLNQTKVTSIPNLTLEIIQRCQIPLPPLNEQSRIVAKIEELFSTLDQMERNLV